MTAVADPQAGLVLPPGDPGALTAAAGVYSAAGGALVATSGQQTAAVSGVVGSAWLGHGAMRCSDAVTQCSSITRSVGDAADAATVALRTCAWGWQEAQAMWRQAQSLAAEAVAEEGAHRAAAALAGMAATVANNPVAAFTDQAAALGADGFESPARAQAVAMGRQAIDLFNQATTRALGALSAADGLLAGVPTTSGGGGGMELLADRSPVLSHYRRQVELLNPGGSVPMFAYGYLSDPCIYAHQCFAKSKFDNGHEIKGRWNPEQTAQSYAMTGLARSPSTFDVPGAVMWEVSPTKGRPTGSQAADLVVQAKGPNGELQYQVYEVKNYKGPASEASTRDQLVREVNSLKGEGLRNVVAGNALGPNSFSGVFPGQGAHSGEVYTEYAGTGKDQGIVWFKSQQGNGPQQPQHQGLVSKAASAAKAGLSFLFKPRLPSLPIPGGPEIPLPIGIGVP